MAIAEQSGRADTGYDQPSIDRVLRAAAGGLRDIVLPAVAPGPAVAWTMILSDVLGEMAHREAVGEREASALAARWSGLVPGGNAVALEDAIRAQGDIDIQAVMCAELAFMDAMTPLPPAAKVAVARSADPTVSADVEAYLRRRMGNEDIQVTRIFTPVGGFSKSLVIAELAGSGRPADGIVIAVDGVGGPIESGVQDEYPLQQALFEAGIALPEPLWLETDAGIFGAPFSIVRQVPGKTAATSHGVDAALAPQAAKALARILAAIHTQPVAGLPGGMEAQAGGAEGQTLRTLAALEEQWLRRRVWSSPTLAAAFAWLAANVPTDAPLGLVHGDASPRNLMLDEAGRTHIIDWELAHFGDPIEDLIYCRPELESVGQWDNFLAEYAACGGPPYDEARAAYWGLWLDLRNAVLSGAGVHGFQAGQQDDIRMVYAGTIYTRKFIQKVGQALLDRMDAGAVPA